MTLLMNPYDFSLEGFFGSRPRTGLETLYFHARDVDTEIDIDYEVLRVLFEKFSHASHIQIIIDGLAKPQKESIVP